MVYLPYGWRDGNLVGINDVERGVACGCICPACRAPLVAKKGNRNVHHFSHFQGVECTGGPETILHLLGKKLLQQAGFLTLPPVKLDNGGGILFPARYCRFDRVMLERRVGQVIPDLIVMVGSRRLLIEVAVTHRVDQRKERRLASLGYAALEIDMHQLGGDTSAFDEEAFRKELLLGTERKRWLYNPRKQALEAKLRTRSRRRQVRKVRGRKGSYYYLVKPCPQERRSFSSPAQDAFFAYVPGDCLHCPFALEIRYEMVHRGYREVPAAPREVFCWGHDPELWKSLK